MAFPNISTGVYSFPKGKAADIAHEVLSGYVYDHIQGIFLVCFDEENLSLYNQLF